MCIALSNFAQSNLTVLIQKGRQLEAELHELDKKLSPFRALDLMIMQFLKFGTAIVTWVRTSALGKTVARFKNLKISRFHPPDGLDIKSLIDATEQAFKVIVAWCRAESE